MLKYFINVFIHVLGGLFQTNAPMLFYIYQLEY